MSTVPLPNPAYQLVIGDIGVTPDGMVSTPSGNFPIRGSQWVVQDMSQTKRVIPTWAIVLAIIGLLFFLLGLLFLLVKEDRTEGWVQVSVTSGSVFHSVQIPVTSRMQVQQIFASVSQAQTLSVR